MLFNNWKVSYKVAIYMASLSKLALDPEKLFTECQGLQCYWRVTLDGRFF